MPVKRPGELPYKTVAGVVPSSVGWLLIGAKVKGTTFSPDLPRVFSSFDDILSHRPAYSIVGVNAPMGAAKLALSGERSCDTVVFDVLGRTVPSTRWDGEPPDLDGPPDTEVCDRREVLGERYRELAEKIAPFLQRTYVEMLPELSFFQLNGAERLRSDVSGPDGEAERTRLLAKVPGISRILGHHLAGVTTNELIEVAALLWSARRVNSRAGRRFGDPEWDENGLRIEIVC
jgi:predicted RNase H-like nuclease